MIKGLIFDYGGTLDTRGDHWAHIIRRAYDDEAVTLPEQAFRDAYVHAERTLARERHILPEHNFLDLMERKIAIEMQWLVSEGFVAEAVAADKAPKIARLCYDFARTCVGEAKPVLDVLAEHFPMVLVSNFYGNVESVLRDFGLDRYFSHIVESAVVGVRKPDPAIFGLGVEALGLQPDEVLVIGDSYRKDILPARSLGCHTAWIKGRGWTADEDAQTDPCQIPSLAALPALLHC